MDEITIVFLVEILGDDFDKIDFSKTTPEFKNIKLQPAENEPHFYNIFIQKKLSQRHPQLKAVIYEAIEEAQKFVYVFSAAADVKIYGLECKGYRQVDNFHNYESIFPKEQSSGFTVELTVTTGTEAIEKIKNSMKNGYNMPNLQMFYDAATVMEPIGRFISLYATLLHYLGDKQKRVDEVILKIDSTVIQTKSPHNNKYETVFTRLRNEISHKRDGIDILRTHDAIRKNIDRFEKIVKTIVIDEKT